MNRVIVLITLTLGTFNSYAGCCRTESGVCCGDSCVSQCALGVTAPRENQVEELLVRSKSGKFIEILFKTRYEICRAYNSIYQATIKNGSPSELWVEAIKRREGSDIPCKVLSNNGYGQIPFNIEAREGRMSLHPGEYNLYFNGEYQGILGIDNHGTPVLR